MQSKQWIVLVIVLGLVLLGSCDDESKSKNKNKDKQEGKDEGKEEEVQLTQHYILTTISWVVFCRLI